jgi:hypothetical protein
MAGDRIAARPKSVSFELLMLLLSPGTSQSPLPKVEEVKQICEAGRRADPPNPAPEKSAAQAGGRATA